MSRTGTHLMRDILRGSGYVGFGPESRFMGGPARFGLYSKPGHQREFRRGHASLTVSEARQLLADIFSPNSKGIWRNAFWQRLASKVDPAVFTERFVDSPRRPQDLFHLALTVHADGGIPGDKTPANLWHLKELLTWFPRARVIHMIRDPRASYASMVRKGWMGPQRLHLPDVKPLRLAVGAMTAVDVACAWRRAVDLDREYSERYPDRYTLCRFEDLVVEPEPVVRRISDFVGVPYLPQMLERSVVDSSYMPRGTPGFRPEAADAWRSHLDGSLIRWFSQLAGPALADHGYSPR